MMLEPRWITRGPELRAERRLQQMGERVITHDFFAAIGETSLELSARQLARVGAMAFELAQKAFVVHVDPSSRSQVPSQLEREAVRLEEIERHLAVDAASFLDFTKAPRKRSFEAADLAADHVCNRAGELRIRVLVRAEQGSQTSDLAILGHPELLGEQDGATQKASQNVATISVRRSDSVRDQEATGTEMIGHDRSRRSSMVAATDSSSAAPSRVAASQQVSVDARRSAATGGSQCESSCGEERRHVLVTLSQPRKVRNGPGSLVSTFEAMTDAFVELRALLHDLDLDEGSWLAEVFARVRPLLDDGTGLFVYSSSARTRRWNSIDRLGGRAHGSRFLGGALGVGRRQPEHDRGSLRAERRDAQRKQATNEAPSKAARGFSHGVRSARRSRSGRGRRPRRAR